MELPLWVSMVFLLLLVLLNGVFAATELALATARKGRLEARARAGDQGARRALALQRDPNRFLATVQVGISLLGTLAAVVGSEKLGEPLTLQFKPYLGEAAKWTALGLVVLGLTFVQLVAGELVPKRLGLAYAVSLASSMSWIMNSLSVLTRPAIWVLGVAVDLILSVLRVSRHSEQVITDEDIRHLVREGTEGGVVHEREEQMIAAVLRLADRLVRHLRTPRADVLGLDVARPYREQIGSLVDSGFSRFPVYRGDLDHVCGVVLARELFQMPASASAERLLALARPASFVPENTRAIELLPRLQKEGHHMVMVVDEHGSFEGVLTLEDILEVIVGQIEDETDEGEPDLQRLGDGSVLVSGATPIVRVKAEVFGVDELPLDEEHRYDTLAGFILSRLGRIPSAGDAATWGEWTLRVVAMDGLRIDRVRIVRTSIKAISKHPHGDSNPGRRTENPLS